MAPPDDAEFPALPLSERDRRWSAARALMDGHDVAALVVLSTPAGADRYLAGEPSAGFVLLPRRGDPVLVTEVPGSLLARFDDAGRAQQRWIADLRFGRVPATVRGLLRERSLEHERIGIVGLTTHGAGPPAVALQAFRALEPALAGVDWVDLSIAFERITLVKSEDELVLVHKAAALGESACRAMLDVARAGVRESVVHAAAEHEVHAGGGHAPPSGSLIRSGGRVLLAGSEWGLRGGAPRVLAVGDLVASERFTYYAGYEAQQQLHLVIGRADALQLELASVARAANEAGAARARPGVTLSEVAAVMHEVVLDAGCWSLAPVVHTLCSPYAAEGPRMVGADRDPELARLAFPLPPSGGVAPDDLVLAEGVVLALQAGAFSGLSSITLGGTVVVRPDGAEELNVLSRELHVV